MNTQDIANREPDAYDAGPKCPRCGRLMYTSIVTDKTYCPYESCQRATRHEAHQRKEKTDA